MRSGLGTNGMRTDLRIYSLTSPWFDLLWEGVQLNGPPPQQTEKSGLYGGARSVLLFYRRE